MEETITLRKDVLQKARQALVFTRFENVEEFVAFLVEEKFNELKTEMSDPIFRLRGKLRGRRGGTSLFMQEKQSEIEREYG